MAGSSSSESSSSGESSGSSSSLSSTSRTRSDVLRGDDTARSGIERDLIEVASGSRDTMVDITGSPDGAVNPRPQGNEEELGGGGSATDLAGEFEDTGESQEVAEPQPSYKLGRSWVTEEMLDSFEAEGLMDSESRSRSRTPGNEEIPHPQPHEAVVFHDFF